MSGADGADDIQAAEDLIGLLTMALDAVVDHVKVTPFAAVQDTAGLVEQVRAAAEAGRSWCRPTCEDEQCDDSCGCPGHAEGEPHWDGQQDIYGDTASFLEQTSPPVTVEQFRRDHGLELEDVIAGRPINGAADTCARCGSPLKVVTALIPGGELFNAQRCTDLTCPHSDSDQPVLASSEFPEYPCPDDPDGQHHVGCGCSF